MTILTTLYDQLKAAGVPLDNHASDLYAKVTPESIPIVKAYGSKAVSVFTSQIDGEPWYDIPFAFLPWWKEKAGILGERTEKGHHPHMNRDGADAEVLELRAENIKLRAENELRKRIISRLPLCPDHRDKVHDVCESCRRERVEEALGILVRACEAGAYVGRTSAAVVQAKRLCTTP